MLEMMVSSDDQECNAMIASMMKDLLLGSLVSLYFFGKR